MIRNSIGAGMLSGLGLGGGVLMIPLYREMKLTAVQASSTGAFNVFVTGIINILQALFLGVLSPSEFFFYFTVSAIGSFCISFLISTYLRKIHRTSIVELLLFLLTIVIVVYLPYTLFAKVASMDWHWSVILGFGSLC
jgi:uncharacterized membrane protein YfcA